MMYLDKKDIKQLDVALLLKDFNEAKKISSIFRKTGIVPQIYEDFKSFFQGTKGKNSVQFAIVDVKMMSQGDFTIQDHPRLVDKTMYISFFFNDQTAPLLISTQEIFNFGYIREGLDYQGQIRPILLRINHYVEQNYCSHLLNKEKLKFEKQVSTITERVENHREIEYYISKLFNFCDELEKQKNASDFLVAIENAFTRIADIAFFSYLEISQNGLKLLSPVSGCKKLKKLPSLWLGQPCVNGIEFFAQNMANQIALDILGSDLICLMIKSSMQNPEKLIFIKVKNDSLINQFKWDYFENYLSGIYNYFRCRNTTTKIDDNVLINSFQLFDKLDESRFSDVRGDDLYLVDVKLTGVQRIVQKNTEMRFYFKDFINDFINALKKLTRENFQYSTHLGRHISFLIKREKNEIFFDIVKKLSNEFPYWKYFEDRDFIFTKEIMVEVKSLPISSVAYTNHLLGSNIKKKIQKTESFVDELIINNNSEISQ